MRADILTFSCFMLLALPVLGDEPEARLTLSGQLEAGGLLQQQRSGTLLDPGGRLVDLPAAQGRTALRLRPAWAQSDALQFRADAWLNLHGAADRRDMPDHTLTEALLEVRPTGRDVLFSAGIGTPAWGTGYAWNPANPLADTRHRLTDQALSHQHPGDPLGTLEWGDPDARWTAFVSRARLGDPALGPWQPRTTHGGLRRQFVGDGSDLLVAYTATPGTSTWGTAYAASVGRQLELHAEVGVSRHRPSAEPAALPGAPALYAWQPAPRRPVTCQALLGGHYTFEDQTQVLFEYLHNGAGWSEPAYAAFLDQARQAAQGAAAGGPATAAHEGFLVSSHAFLDRLLRHYGFLRLHHKSGNDTEFGTYLRYGFDDESFLQGVYLSRRMTPEAVLRMHFEYHGGARNSETRLFPASRQAGAAIVLHF